MLFAQTFLEWFFAPIIMAVGGLLLLFYILPKGTGTGAAKIGLSALLKSLFGK